MNYINLFIFGDSVSYGKYDTQGGWVSRLKKHFDFANADKSSDNYVNLFNLSIPGNNSEKLLEQINFEIKQRLHKNTQNFILIAIGANDPSSNISVNNLKKIIIFAKKYSNNIFLISYVDENNSLINLSKAMNTNYINASIPNSKILKYMCDNKHPNSLGHRLIYNKILKFLHSRLNRNSLVI